MGRTGANQTLFATRQHYLWPWRDRKRVQMTVTIILTEYCSGLIGVENCRSVKSGRQALDRAWLFPYRCGVQKLTAYGVGQRDSR